MTSSPTSSAWRRAAGSVASWNGSWWGVTFGPSPRCASRSSRSTAAEHQVWKGNEMGSHLHCLSGIDEENRTAICSTCGPVGIKRRGYPNVGWRCRRGARRFRGNIETIRAGRRRKARRREHDGRTLKRPYRKHLGLACCRCGFVPEHSCQLDVDHVNRNHKDNEPSNLQTLCANCHRLKTYLERRGLPFDSEKRK